MKNDPFLIRPQIVLLLLVFILGLIPPLRGGNVRIPFKNSQVPQTAQPGNIDSFGKLPLSFEMNGGQADQNVKFFSRGPGYGIFFSTDEVHLVLHYPIAENNLPAKGLRHPHPKFGAECIHMRLLNADTTANIQPMNELPGVSNYFIGNDHSRWLTGIKHYSSVQLSNVLPGIDLQYYGNQGRLEHDFTVSPGADPKLIQWEISGAGKKTVDGNGDLILETSHGEVNWKSPQCYQWVNGQKQVVDGRYVLLSENLVGFEIGSYRKDLPLVIDPYIVYSTYLGGSNRDSITDVAVDASGDAYVYGTTGSTNFPIMPGAYQPSIDGNTDLFVTKFDPTGTVLIYSTYIGGSGQDESFGMAMDGTGNVYLTGQTQSTDFPLVNPFQATPAWIFVAKLNSTGSALLYSTYLGDTGTGIGLGYGIAVDSSGSAYVTGYTDSASFPTVNPFQSTPAGSPNGFITKFSPAGNTLVYSTYLGGSTGDVAQAIAVDGAGAAYVTGNTESTNFPTQNPFQAALDGTDDIFVTKINPAGNTLAYSTYLGGNNGTGLGQIGYAIAVDSTGCAYVTGETNAPDFPVVNAFQATAPGAFLTKFNPAGNTLAFSTYLGGNGADRGLGIALDSSNDIFLCLSTTSTNLPLVNPIQSALGGTENAFVCEFNPTASALIYSTYWGATAPDVPEGIVLDSWGDVYVGGTMNTGTFPTVNPYQASYGGGVWDGFVFEIANGPTRTPTPTPTASLTRTMTDTPTITVTWTNTPSWTPTNSITPTTTITWSPTPTTTSTGTQTFSSTPTPTYTETSTFTGSPTNTPTGTFTGTPTPTFTDTSTVIDSPTNTPTGTFTSTPTPTYTCTSTFTDTPTSTTTGTFTSTPTNTATGSMTQSPTATFTNTSTPTPTLSLTVTGTPTVTSSPTPTSTQILTGVTIEVPFPNPSQDTRPVTCLVLAPPGSTVEWGLFTLAFRKILDKTVLIPGQNATLVWNQQDKWGNLVSNGLYYLRVQVTGSSNQTKIWKLLVIR